MLKIQKAIKLLEENQSEINDIIKKSSVYSFDENFCQYIIRQLKTINKIHKAIHPEKRPNVKRDLTYNGSLKQYCVGMTIAEIKNEFKHNFNSDKNQIYINKNYYQLYIDNTFGNDTDICEDVSIIIINKPHW